MRESKEAAFAFTYKQEGGYGNDPHDPGGATNLGIIQTEYNAFRQDKGEQAQSVKYITKEEADEIYTRFYWDKVHGDYLPAGVDLVVYDYAVNSGVYRAVRYAQWVLGVETDGVIGPITLQAFKTVDPKIFIDTYDKRRLSFLQGLGTFQYFGTGWTRRVKEATNAALKLAGEAPKYVTSQTETKPMWLEIVLGIARHVITGGGASAVGLTGFDLHNPMTWIGIASFLGGSTFSAIDKAQKSGHFDLLSILTDTLGNVNTKLDEAAKSKAG